MTQRGANNNSTGIAKPTHHKSASMYTRPVTPTKASRTAVYASASNSPTIVLTKTSGLPKDTIQAIQEMIAFQLQQVTQEMMRAAESNAKPLQSGIATVAKQYKEFVQYKSKVEMKISELEESLRM